jgi:CMP-N,N'-diacetyllegionaminic acid synthase
MESIMKINTDNITAIIAVKGESERVPKKNIRKFSGSSLLEIKLQQLKSGNVFSKILVSSESDEVLSKALPFDVKIHKRDQYYSTSSVPMSEVYEYLAKQVETDYIAWIPVTNPLVDEKIYIDAVATFKTMDHNRYDSLLSVNEVHEYLYHNEKALNFSRDPWLRSQDLTGVFAINFAINIISKENMIKNRATLGEKPKFFTIPKKIAIDIDYMEDFIFAEILFKQQLKDKNNES